jgi:hypothetical protein
MTADGAISIKKAVTTVAVPRRREGFVISGPQGFEHVVKTCSD